MAYETGTANSPGDLLVKLFDFAALHGWTVDDDIASDAKTPPEGAIHKNNIYVSFYFFTDNLKIYPARGYSGANEPGTQTESLYNDTLTTQNSGMGVTNIAGPYSAYHFFEDDNYLHIVINTSDGRFRHFGFGESIKFGDWKYGEYFYGHVWGTTSLNSPNASRHSPPFSCFDRSQVVEWAHTSFYGKTNTDAALPGARAADAFWIRAQNVSTPASLDADSRLVNAGMILSGTDGGIHGNLVSRSPSDFNGFNAMFPIQWGLLDNTPTPRNFYFLGTIPDIRSFNCKEMTTSIEHTIGADTWVLFPVTNGGPDPGTSVEWSANHGIAYKKVTT